MSALAEHREPPPDGGPAAVLDVKGLNCPLPLLKCKVALNRLAPGQVLQVLATDPLASLDFQAFCARTGHELIAMSEQVGVWEFWIRKTMLPG
jgi:tRNA 2-thiouridine synthesizing protein A